MKKALFLVAVLVACASAPLSMVEAAQEADGAEIDVWYYYLGTAPPGESSLSKLVRMHKVDTVWPNCEITLTDIPDHPEFENFIFSHWSVWVSTSYGMTKIGDYSDEEIQGLTISYTPEKLYERVYMYYVDGIYVYDYPEPEPKTNSLSIYVYIIICIILVCSIYYLYKIIG